jgi:ABC-type polar amino acid transport system ATPase subunit
VSNKQIEMSEVEKWYGNFQVLKRISLDIARGEVLAVIGPSGGGKTTLMRVLAQLESFQKGSIRIGDQALAAGQIRNRVLGGKVGVVFQGIHLFPHLSVLDNVTVAPTRAGKMDVKEAEQLAHELLDKVGVPDQAGKRPHALSGGQQQRVAIARALAMQPDILILDEPTSALDPERVLETARLVSTLAKSGNLTALVITHGMGFAREIADRIAFLEDGKIIEVFNAKEQPSHPRVEAYLNRLPKES